MNKITNSRSPTLETVLMVEKTIERFSGKFDRTDLWKKLPRKVMWQTFLHILEFLKEINKIHINQDKLHHNKTIITTVNSPCYIR
jgi:hypothetical protein